MVEFATTPFQEIALKMWMQICYFDLELDSFSGASRDRHRGFTLVLKI